MPTLGFPALARTASWLALFVAVAAPALPQGSRGGAQPPPEAELVALSALRDAPGAALGKTVRFVLQFEAEVEGFWNPYVSRFGPKDYARYRGWSDESFLWELAAFADPAPYLLARRGSVADRLLANAQPYERFEVRGVVREVFLGEPWIEIERVDRLAAFVSEGTILHAVRGLELFAEGRPTLALAQLERARAGLLPAHALAELERLIETCREAPPERPESKPAPEPVPEPR